MNVSIDDKIKQLDELSERAMQFDEDFDEIAEVRRKLFLLIKHCFGENSAYMTDYNKIDVPEEDDDQQINAKNLKQLQKTVKKLLDMMDTMREDLQISCLSTDNSDKKAKENKPTSKSVFIVHGTDHKPVLELKTILNEAGFTPIILHEQPGGSRTIVEKLEKYSNVGYAFVLLTPDDIGCKSQSGDISWIMPALANKTGLQISPIIFQMFKPRARQNVVLEFGYFIGKLGRDRVCCLLKGNVEKPSDMAGIAYLPFVSTVEEIRPAIIEELKASGYETKL